MTTPVPTHLLGPVNELARLIVDEGMDICFVPITDLRRFGVNSDAGVPIASALMQHWQEIGCNWYISYDLKDGVFVAINRQYSCRILAIRAERLGRL